MNASAASTPSSTSQLGDVRHHAIVDEHVAAPHGRPCEACGAPVEPLDKFCPACGNPQHPKSGDVVDAQLSPTEHQATDALAQAAPAEVVHSPASSADHAEERARQKFFRCNQCGSEVGMDLNQRSYSCPFCDSSYVVEFAPEISGRQRPEFVIGFGVTPAQAQAKFQQWLTDNSWFRPGDLAKNSIVDKMRGVYLPFWSFSMLAQSVWQAEIGEHWYRTETYTTTGPDGKLQTRTRQVQETEWWPLAGRHHRYYAGYLVSGSRGLPQAEADRIQPFQLPALRRYEPFYLAGWLCEEYSIDDQIAMEASRQEFFRREQANVAAFMPGDTHRGLHVETHFSQASSDLCLLPVYVLSYRYQGRLYRFLINGQTGKTTGDKPVSTGRIAAAIAIGLAILVVIGLLIAALSH